MDKRGILISLFVSCSLYGAPNANEIYDKTVKMFSIPEIKFQVASTLTSGNYQEKRLFSMSRMEQGKNSSLLICFSSPAALKGTAMLLKKSPQDSQTYVYLPSLERVRLIPKQNEREEAFGLGISYAEMQNQNDEFFFIKTFSEEGNTFHKIAKRNGNRVTYYSVDAENNRLKKMEIVENTRLEKEIFIDEIKTFKGNMIITKWHIQDYLKNETLRYDVNENSMQSILKERDFALSSLSHCKP